MLKLISSMATRLLLNDVLPRYTAERGVEVEALAIGGVDAAKRVAAGEAFDVVMLGSDALDKLVAAGHAIGPWTPVVDSGVAVAVQAGAPVPDLADEVALKAAVLAAPRLAYSTGPSGVALAKLFERWGVADVLASRLVTAPPGVPVGTLVARGEVDLGFQQLSELLPLQGITIAGPLPAAVQITTTFAAAAVTAGQQTGAVADLLAYLASPALDDLKRQHGMAPPATR